MIDGKIDGKRIFVLWIFIGMIGMGGCGGGELKVYQVEYEEPYFGVPVTGEVEVYGYRDLMREEKEDRRAIARLEKERVLKVTGSVSLKGGGEIWYEIELEGIEGVDGMDGTDGTDGTLWTDGVDGVDGMDGVDRRKGFVLFGELKLFEDYESASRFIGGGDGVMDD